MPALTFTASSATDQLTATAHGLKLLDVVVVRPVDGASLPAPLQEGVPYWVVRVDANNIKLALHGAAALNGPTTIDLTSNGSGTLIVERVP